MVCKGGADVRFQSGFTSLAVAIGEHVFEGRGNGHDVQVQCGVTSLAGAKCVHGFCTLLLKDK